LQLLVEIRKAYNLTIIVVTHNDQIAAMADRVLTMKAGLAEIQSRSLPDSTTATITTATAEKTAQLLDLGVPSKVFSPFRPAKQKKRKLNLSGLSSCSVALSFELVIFSLVALPEKITYANFCFTSGK